MDLGLNSHVSVWDGLASLGSLLLAPLFAVLAVIAGRVQSRIYRNSSLRNSHYGFAMMYLSWLLWGAATIALYVQF